MANVNDVVKYSCEVSQSQTKDGKKVNTVPLTLSFDFTGVSTSALRTQAIRAIVVTLASKLRGATTRKEKPITWKAAVDSVNGKTIKVADFLSTTRTRATTPEQKAARIAKQATKQDAATLQATIKMLQAQLAGKK